MSDERRDRPRPLPGVSKRLLRRLLLVPFPRRDRRLSTGSRLCPLAPPWRDRRHLAHVLPPSLSFVLDV